MSMDLDFLERREYPWRFRRVPVKAPTKPQDARSAAPVGAPLADDFAINLSRFTRCPEIIRRWLRGD
jgi:precorrin-3B methylase